MQGDYLKFYGSVWSSYQICTFCYYHHENRNSLSFCYLNTKINSTISQSETFSISVPLNWNFSHSKIRFDYSDIFGDSYLYWHVVLIVCDFNYVDLNTYSPIFPDFSPNFMRSSFGYLIIVGHRIRQPRLGPIVDYSTTSVVAFALFETQCLISPQ